MLANLENSALATGLEKISFHFSAKECSNYHTLVLISDTTKVMLKILQARFQQYVNQELPDVQIGFRKVRGTRDQIANIKRISALLTMPKPLTVWITTNWKILKEMGMLDHFICLLRNLYAGQEATESDLKQ